MRALLLTLLLALSLPTLATPRVATVDWTIGETLLALGTPPVAMADLTSYRNWVGEPFPPATTVDIGLRGQPNRELLSELAPDMILISPMAAPLEPVLKRIAPVHTVALYTPEKDYWVQLSEQTLGVGQLIGKPQEARQLLDNLSRDLASKGKALHAVTTPLLMLQFIDERHVRIYGKHSMFQSVIERMGLRNAWQQETNYWGFSTAAIEQFATLENVQVVIVEPIPLGVRERLQRSALWQNLAVLKQHPPLYLPVIWSFGGVPSAQRFADNLTTALLSKGAS